MGNLRMNADQISYKGGEKPMSVEQAIKNAGNTGLAHTADIAPDFSTESAYSAGDYVYHNGTLYVFTSNHAAGAWSTSDTQAVTVGGEIATLTGEAADLYSGKANQITIAPFFSENTAYDPGDLVYYNGLSYRCVNAHEGEWDADDFAATTIANELSSLMSGLTSQLEINVTLPATTDGRSSVQLPDATIPAGAKVVGCVISNVSTYSDGVSISAYFIGRTCRVTMVSNMNDIPQITLKLIVGITY